jgi:hypothetical protein
LTIIDLVLVDGQKQVIRILPVVQFGTGVTSASAALLMQADVNKNKILVWVAGQVVDLQVTFQAAAAKVQEPVAAHVAVDQSVAPELY